jgi:hypothetical protein
MAVGPATITVFVNARKVTVVKTVAVEHVQIIAMVEVTVLTVHASVELDGKALGVPIKRV